MGSTYDLIDDHLRDWIASQPLYFVASAPLSGEGHVNLSPKGPIGTLRVIGPTEIAYLDTVGSGAETVAHLRENGRIVVMLCAFDGPPRIVRFHGRGEVILPRDERFAALLAEGDFEDASLPQARRAIIVVDVTRVGDSCGYGVPLMAFEGTRDHHALATAKRLRTLGEDGYAAHRAQSNTVSLDGLPAVDGTA